MAHFYGFEVALGSTRFSYQWHTIPPKGGSQSQSGLGVLSTSWHS